MQTCGRGVMFSIAIKMISVQASSGPDCGFYLNYPGTFNNKTGLFFYQKAINMFWFFDCFRYTI